MAELKVGIALVNCEFLRDLGPVVALYDRYWTEIKAR